MVTGIKSLYYQLTISIIIGAVFFLMSANFAFGQAFTLDVNALNNEALELIRSGNYQESLELLDMALEIDPNYIHALNNKGNALHALSEYEEAIVWFDKALEVDPNYNYALSNKANSLYALSEYEEAIVWFDKALEVDPDHINALNNKGYALYKLERYEEAISSYNKALEVDPNYNFAKSNKQLAENPPIHDSIFEGFQLLILVPIVFGIYLKVFFKGEKSNLSVIERLKRKNTKLKFNLS